MTNLIKAPDITRLEICQIFEQALGASRHHNVLTPQAPYGSVQHIASAMPQIFKKAFEAGWVRGIADCRGEILPAAAPSAVVSAISDDFVLMLQQCFSSGYAHGVKAGFSPIAPDCPDVKVSNAAAVEQFLLQKLITNSSSPRKRTDH